MKIEPSNNIIRNHLNYGLVFALQASLMLFSLAVALLLAGLFSVVFGPLGSSYYGEKSTRYMQS